MSSIFDNTDIKSLYTFNVSEKFGEEYKPVADDVLRILVIQIVVQLMFFLNDPKENPFYTEYFAATLLYIVVGLLVYWLIVRKIIKID